MRRILRKQRAESRWDRVDGLRMHARISPDSAPKEALPVILVHGLVVSSRYMVPVLLRLATHYRVYAPDLPGFGRSEKPPRVLGVPGLSDALATWMSVVGLERAVLVGNSLGCQIIADLAACRPSLAERVVLQGPTMDHRARTAPRQAGRFLLDAPREPLSLLPIELLDYLQAGFRRAWRTFQLTLEDHIEDKLPQVRAPALVVRGERDPISPQSWCEEVARLLPQGGLTVLPSAAHTANFGAPDEFVRVIHGFVEADIRTNGKTT